MFIWKRGQSFKIDLMKPISDSSRNVITSYIEYFFTPQIII